MHNNTSRHTSFGAFPSSSQSGSQSSSQPNQTWSEMVPSPTPGSFSGQPSFKKPRRDDTVLNNNAPSKVLHIRNIPIAEVSVNWNEELLRALSPFGNIVYVVPMPKNSQALVEMGSVEEAAAVVTFCSSRQLYVGHNRLEIVYSKSNELNRAGGDSGGGLAGLQDFDRTEVHRGERILLLTILNPMYPITVDVLSRILIPYGRVLRIVIFHKTGVQAFVEFESGDAARHAREMLDGKCIYENCCCLRIKYSKIENLKVRQNDDKTRDFTDDSLPTGGSSDMNDNGILSSRGLHQSSFTSPSYPSSTTLYDRQANTAMNSNSNNNNYTRQLGTSSTQASVLLVNGLAPDVSATYLFNLFCIYGNIIKIKIIPPKEDGKRTCALIQMGDDIQANSALINLHHLPMPYGDSLFVVTSKHAYIADSNTNRREQVMEDDGTGAIGNNLSKDYSESSLNRYRSGTPSRHVYRPSSVIHFTNAAPSTTEDSLRDVFATGGVEVPADITMFEPSKAMAGNAQLNRPPRKSGLLGFSSPTAAVHAIARLNNMRIDGHTLRLSFSDKESAIPREKSNAEYEARGYVEEQFEGEQE